MVGCNQNEEFIESFEAVLESVVEGGPVHDVEERKERRHDEDEALRAGGIQ